MRITFVVCFVSLLLQVTACPGNDGTPGVRLSPAARYRLTLDLDFASRVRKLLLTKAVGLESRLSMAFHPQAAGVLGLEGFLPGAQGPSYAYVEGRDERRMCPVIDSAAARVPGTAAVVAACQSAATIGRHVEARRRRDGLVDAFRVTPYLVTPAGKGGLRLAYDAAGRLVSQGEAGVYSLQPKDGGFTLRNPLDEGTGRFLGRACAILAFLAPPCGPAPSTESPGAWRTDFGGFPAAFTATMGVLWGERAAGFVAKATFPPLVMSWTTQRTAEGLVLEGRLERPVPVTRDGGPFVRIASLERRLVIDSDSGVLIADEGKGTFDGIVVNHPLFSVSDAGGTISYRLTPEAAPVAVLPALPTDVASFSGLATVAR